MAIARVRQTTFTGTSSPLAGTITAAATGNLLVVYVASNSSVLRTVSTITCTNCTFTKLGSASNGTVGVEIWGAIPTATSGTSLSIAFSSTVSACCANVTEFSGVASKTVDATAVANSGTSTAPTAGAYSVPGAGDLILVAEAHPNTTAPTVEPSGYANDETTTSASTTLSIDPDFKAGAAAGSQSATWTIGSAAWATVIVGLRAAVGALPSVSDSSTTSEAVVAGKWLNSTTITVDHTKVSGTANLANFPLLVSVATNASFKSIANSGGVGNSDGSDIYFTIGGVKCAHEIEQYSATTGNLIAWVQVPSLSFSADTVVKMWYGNVGATDMQAVYPAKASVWDTPNYAAVWHMKDGTTSTIPDSSSSAATLTKTSAGHPAIASLSGEFSDDAEAFNNVAGAAETDYATVASLFSIANVATITAWVNITAIDTTNPPAGSGAEIVSLGDTLALRADDISSGVMGFYYDGTTWNTTAATTPVRIVGTGWRHLAYICNPAASSQNVLVDGASIGTRTSATSYSSAGQGTSTHIGQHGNGSTIFHVIGKLDEVRIAKAALTPDWIKTEYNNQSAPGTFYSFPSTALTISVSDATGATTESVTAKPVTARLLSDATAATTEAVTVSIGSGLAALTPSVSDAVTIVGTIDSSQMGSFVLQPPAENRNNFTGSVGYVFQVTAPVVVTALGRGYQLTSSHDHAVHLWISTDTTTPLVSAVVRASSSADSLSMHWTPIASVVLTPGNTYALMSDEDVGGDQWPDDWSDATRFNQAYLSNVAAAANTLAQAQYPNFQPGSTSSAYGEVGMQFNANIGVISISLPSVNDATGATTESVTTSNNSSVSVSDATASTNESVTAVTSAIITSVSDATAAATEFVSVAAITRPSVSDATAATTESVQAVTAAIAASVADTTAATAEFLGVQPTTQPSVSDATATTADSVAAAVNAIPLIFDTTGATTESVTPAVKTAPLVFDSTAATTEASTAVTSALQQAGVFDAATITESAALTTGLAALAISDATAATTEGAAAVVASAPLVFDATGATTDSVTPVEIDFVAPFDSLTITESAPAAVRSTPLVFDATGATTEAITAVSSAIQATVFDSTATSEAVTAAAAAETVSVFEATGSTTESVAAVVVAAPSATIAVNDALSGNESIVAALGTTAAVVETPATSESVAAAVTAAAISVFDANTATEAVTAVRVDAAAATIAVSDATAATTENITEAVSTAALVVDATGATTESVAARDISVVAPFESAATSEAASASLGTGPLVFDSEATSEFIAAIESAIQASVTDTAAITESLAAATAAEALSVVDASTETEAVSAVVVAAPSAIITVNDAASSTEAVTPRLTTTAALSDTPATAEAVALTAGEAVSVFDASTETEAVTAVRVDAPATIVAVNDAATASESAAATLTTRATLADAPATTEAVALTTAAETVSIFDAAVLAESVTANAAGPTDAIVAADAGTVSDSVSVQTSVLVAVNELIAQVDALATALTTSTQVFTTCASADAINTLTLNFIGVLDATIGADALAAETETDCLTGEDLATLEWISTIPSVPSTWQVRKALAVVQPDNRSGRVAPDIRSTAVAGENRREAVDPDPRSTSVAGENRTARADDLVQV